MIIVLLTVVSLKKPVLMILLYLFIHISVTFLNRMFIISENLLAIGFGINLPDLLLVLMAVAIFFYLYNNNSFLSRNRFFFTLSLLFLLYLLFEIGRNISQHGISAPGEFRFRYLIMLLFYYVIVLIDDEQKIKSLFKGLIILSLFIPLLLFPIIGFSKGWQFGAEHRFFNASISLGIIYGITAWLIAIKYRFFKSKLFTFFFIIFSLFLIVIDSHRSVWITLVAMIFFLFYFNEINMVRVLKYFIPTLLVILTIYILVNAAGLDFLEYVRERGGEIINPGSNSTAYWRLSLWKAQSEKFLASPLLGDGFGGYWQIFVPEFNRTIDISPHSLYVQTLVKLGMIGFLLYGAIVIHCFARLLKQYRLFKRIEHSYTIYFLISMIVLVGSHVYYSVYAFEPFSLIFSGLGLSLAFRLHENSK